MSSISHEWANLTTGVFTVSGKNEALEQRETQITVDLQIC